MLSLYITLFQRNLQMIWDITWHKERCMKRLEILTIYVRTMIDFAVCIFNIGGPTLPRYQYNI